MLELYFLKIGVYNIDRTIVLKSNWPFVGEDGVVFKCFNGVVFDTESDGYSSSTISLMRNVNSHDTNIELSSTTGLKINDYIKMSDDLIVGRCKNAKNAKIISNYKRQIFAATPSFFMPFFVHKYQINVHNSHINGN